MTTLPLAQNNGSEVLTLAEAARVLRCSKGHLSNVVNGRVPSLPPLPHIALGRRILIRRAALEQWLERLEQGGDRR
jgi:excisionase family DNA binding protein